MVVVVVVVVVVVLVVVVGRLGQSHTAVGISGRPGSASKSLVDVGHHLLGVAACQDGVASLRGDVFALFVGTETLEDIGETRECRLYSPRLPDRSAFMAPGLRRQADGAALDVELLPAHVP